MTDKPLPTGAEVQAWIDETNQEDFATTEGMGYRFGVENFMVDYERFFELADGLYVSRTELYDNLPEHDGFYLDKIEKVSPEECERSERMLHQFAEIFGRYKEVA